jgi:hypothetical protein
LGDPATSVPSETAMASPKRRTPRESDGVSLPCCVQAPAVRSKTTTSPALSRIPGAPRNATSPSMATLKPACAARTGGLGTSFCWRNQDVPERTKT